MLEDLADPAAALDAAVLAGVVVETGDRLSAAHPLIGAAAVESLPPARRAQLYRRLADASSNPERTRTSRPWPPGLVRTRRSPKRWTRPLRPRTPGPPTPPLRSSLHRRSRSRPSRAPTRWCAAGNQGRASCCSWPARWSGHWSTSRRSTSTSSTTEDLERALPMLTDVAEPGARRGRRYRDSHPCRRRRRARSPRRALVLALASDIVYGIRGRRRAAARGDQLRRGRRPGRCAVLHRALLNLVVAKVSAAEGLDAGLLERAETPRGGPARAPAARHAPTCTAGCGRGAPRTWTPRGPRCGGPSPAPGRPARTTRW